VATAPAEELLLGRRRPVRNWTCQACILCRKLHLFLGKSTKTVATRPAFFDSNMHQIVCRLGLCEVLGALSTPQTLYLYLGGGATSKGRGTGKEGRERRRSGGEVRE